MAPVCCTYLVSLTLSLWFIYPESRGKVTFLSKLPETNRSRNTISDTILKIQLLI